MFAPAGSRRAITVSASAAATLTLVSALTLSMAPAHSAAPTATPGAAPAAAAVPGNVDAARLAAADKEPQNWFTGGRDKDGTYYSPMANIDAKNVKQLGFAWQYDLGEPMRGQEATPIDRKSVV